MKQTFLVILGLFCWNWNVSAEVFVYRNKLAHVYTGPNGTSKSKVAGWTVLDETGKVVQVIAYTAERSFSVAPMESIEYGVSEAGNGRQYTYFIQHDLWNDSNGMHLHTGGAKGINVPTTINGQQWNIPKTYTWAGRSVDPTDSSGGKNFTESSGSMTLDMKWSQICNAEGDNPTTAARRLADSLVEQGYREF